MSDPRYHVARRVDAPAEVVLAALTRSLRTARRDLPLHRPKGVYGARGRLRGDRFTVWPDRLLEGVDTQLAGVVRACDDGGSDVRASVLDEPGAGGLVLVLLALAAVAAVAGIGGAWWLVGVAAVVGIITAVRRAAGAIDHAEAAFLRDWLNAVLDDVQASPGLTIAPDRPAPSDTRS